MAVKKKIVVVDDDHDVLDLLEIFLYQNYDLYVALSGFDALKICEQITPACIITDIVMPTMDGIKLFNALRKKTKLAQVPIIAITSFGGRKHSVKSLTSMGFVNTIKKPFNRAKIVAAVEAAVAGTPSP